MECGTIRIEDIDNEKRGRKKNRNLLNVDMAQYLESQFDGRQRMKKYYKW